LAKRLDAKRAPRGTWPLFFFFFFEGGAFFCCVVTVFFAGAAAFGAGPLGLEYCTPLTVAEGLRQMEAAPERLRRA